MSNVDGATLPHHSKPKHNEVGFQVVDLALLPSSAHQTLLMDEASTYPTAGKVIVGLKALMSLDLFSGMFAWRTYAYETQHNV